MERKSRMPRSGSLERGLEVLGGQEEEAGAALGDEGVGPRRALDEAARGPRSRRGPGSPRPDPGLSGSGVMVSPPSRTTKRPSEGWPAWRSTLAGWRSMTVPMPQSRLSSSRSRLWKRLQSRRGVRSTPAGRGRGGGGGPGGRRAGRRGGHDARTSGQAGRACPGSLGWAAPGAAGGAGPGEPVHSRRHVLVVEAGLLEPQVQLPGLLRPRPRAPEGGRAGRRPPCPPRPGPPSRMRGERKLSARSRCALLEEDLPRQEAALGELPVLGRYALQEGQGQVGPLGLEVEGGGLDGIVAPLLAPGRVQVEVVLPVDVRRLLPGVAFSRCWAARIRWPHLMKRWAASSFSPARLRHWAARVVLAHAAEGLGRHGVVAGLEEGLAEGPPGLLRAGLVQEDPPRMAALAEVELRGPRVIAHLHGLPDLPLGERVGAGAAAGPRPRERVLSLRLGPRGLPSPCRCCCRASSARVVSPMGE